MAYIAPKIAMPITPTIKTWSPSNLYGGLNLIEREWKVSDNQTPKVLNMIYREGELSKRQGQAYVNTDLGTQIFNSYRYKFMGKIIFHSGTKLYSLDTTTGATTELYSALNATKGTFFKFNSKLYYRQAGKYIQWDGTTASVVTPYVPTIIINRTYSGGGNVNEGYNRIGKGFINAFITDGTHTVFPLTDINLDATPLVASNDNGSTWTLLEGTNFTVNRTTGVVTFTVAPITGTNLYRIKAYKTIQADIDSILNCTQVIPFGGQNDNRVFFGANGTGTYFWSGISSVGVDATYFPYNNYNIIGLPDEPIYGFGKQYDTLCIFKAREIYGVTYTWNGTIGVFSSAPINDQYGCDCSDTIQSINNSLVWLNSTYGVCILVGTTVGSHRNAFPISRNINPRLMTETTLTSATSIDFNGKYWLCVGDKVYLWDYFISPYVDTGNPEESAKRLSWWYFDNISASSWIVDGQDLFYTHRTLGRVVKFINVYDGTQFYDFGLAYNSMYRIPLRDLGNGTHEFDVLALWVDCRGDTRSGILVTYITSDDINGDPSTDEITVGSFSYDTFSYDTFTYQVMGYKETFPLSPMEKKIDLFGMELSNDEGGRDMNISGLTYSYRIGKRK